MKNRLLKTKFHYNKVNSHNRGKRHIMNLVPWRTNGHGNSMFTRIQRSVRSKGFHTIKASLTGTTSQLRVSLMYHRCKMAYEKKDYYLKDRLFQVILSLAQLLQSRDPLFPIITILGLPRVE